MAHKRLRVTFADNWFIRAKIAGWNFLFGKWAMRIELEEE